MQLEFVRNRGTVFGAKACGDNACRRRSSSESALTCLNNMGAWFCPHGECHCHFCADFTNSGPVITEGSFEGARVVATAKRAEMSNWLGHAAKIEIT